MELARFKIQRRNPHTFSLIDEQGGDKPLKDMVLDKLHVLECSTSPVGQSHAISGFNAGVGGKRKDLTAAAGAEQDDFGHYGMELARFKIQRRNPHTFSLFDEQGGDKPLIIAPDLGVLE